MPNERERASASGWGCTVCGYIFEPGTLDPAGAQIDPAKTFERLAEDWTCPKCGSGKHHFRLRRHKKDAPEPNG
ncbi:MAG: rubredoxin [Candidatus Bipolaricaulota bacterium]|nr:rubredoxin [Candidatus Bipolaricaulota bacterium]